MGRPVVIGFENSQVAVGTLAASATAGRAGADGAPSSAAGGGVRLKGDNVRKSNHLE